VGWFRKAAEQGDAKAQGSLGSMYYQGRGVKQDDGQAVGWFRKAAEQGYAVAQFLLALTYENGRGVKQDDVQATAWYRKAAEQGYADAQKRLNRLQQKLACVGKAQTALFGVKLQCAGRDELMAAVKAAGAGVKQEDKNTWGDSYLSAGVLDGSSELYLGYTADDQFAVAEYTFPGFMDAGLVSKVRGMAQSKYGAPASSSGNVGLGPVSYRWRTKDGIEIEVRRGWPDTTTYLTFTYLEHYLAMKMEQQRQKQESERKKYNSQKSAF